MEIESRLRQILRDALQVGARAESMNAATALLGSIPEFDSMAVVSVITAIEDEFGITVADDEISAETFATFGSLAELVRGKLES
jgi:acyl carrier protein